MEYELLRFFVTNPGRVWSREQLLSRVWGYDYFGGARTVDVHVRRLRAKLGEDTRLVDHHGALGRLPVWLTHHGGLRRVSVLIVGVLVTACAHGARVEPPRYDPEAPEIVSPSTVLVGEGYRFVIGVDGKCLSYRIEAAGLQPRGGIVCPQGPDDQTSGPRQVDRNSRSSSDAFLVVYFDGCVRAPAVVDAAFFGGDSTTTSICDDRMPAVVFGRIYDPVAYGCIVAPRSRARFVKPNVDGVFAELDTWGQDGFNLGFRSTGYLDGSEPVDQPFASGLAACEAIAPWLDRGADTGA